MGTVHDLAGDSGMQGAAKGRRVDEEPYLLRLPRDLKRTAQRHARVREDNVSFKDWLVEAVKEKLAREEKELAYRVGERA